MLLININNYFDYHVFQHFILTINNNENKYNQSLLLTRVEASIKVISLRIHGHFSLSRRNVVRWNCLLFTLV